MSPTILRCEQNSPEWMTARAGLATASEFATVMASGRGGAESKTRATYLKKLAGEIVTGQPAENYSNGFMDRGHAMEDRARKYYAFLRDCEPEQVGFIRNDDLRAGYSPDSLIDADGLIEIKSKAPHLLIDWLTADKFPAEHVAQCQGGLWIAEREWIDIIGYFDGMPTFIKRAYRDDVYIRNLAAEVARFNEELDALVSRIRSYFTEAA